MYRVQPQHWVIAGALALLALVQLCTLGVIARHRRKVVAAEARVGVLQQKNYQLWQNVRSIGQQVGWTEDLALTQMYDPSAPGFTWEGLDEKPPASAALGGGDARLLR